MKKIKKITAIILILAAIVILFAGCGKREEAPPEPQFTQAELEMQPVFEQAELVYSWFTGSTAVETSDEQIDIGGNSYSRVTQQGIENMEQLRAVVARCFTGELTDELLATQVYAGVPLFIERNGALYIYSGYTGIARRDIGERVGHIVSQSDAQLIYSVDMSYTYYNETVDAHYDYEYVLCDDGQWRFSTFELPADMLGTKMFG